MRTIRVLIPFVHDGKTYEVGEIVEVPDHALHALGEHAEVIDGTSSVSSSKDFDDRLQAQSSAYVAFCLAHQSTFEGGRCSIQGDRRDPLTRCLWWQQMNRRSS